MRSSLFCAYFSRFSSEVCYYNLSPQGDGNKNAATPTLTATALQLIPARGRKPSSDPLELCATATITTYPRKGTETHLVESSVQLHVDYNLSPQGDGNLAYPVLYSYMVKLQLIPARGQKSTSATGVCQQRRCFAFSDILFYRLGAAPAGIVFVTGSALMPCGTFRFRGRISCR